MADFSNSDLTKLLNEIAHADGEDPKQLAKKIQNEAILNYISTRLLSGDYKLIKREETK